MRSSHSNLGPRGMIGGMPGTPENADESIARMIARATGSTAAAYNTIYPTSEGLPARASAKGKPRAAAAAKPANVAFGRARTPPGGRARKTGGGGYGGGGGRGDEARAGVGAMAGRRAPSGRARERPPASTPPRYAAAVGRAPKAAKGRAVAAILSPEEPSDALYHELQALKAQQEHMRGEFARQQAEMAAVAAEAKRAAAVAAAVARERDAAQSELMSMRQGGGAGGGGYGSAADPYAHFYRCVLPTCRHRSLNSTQLRLNPPHALRRLDVRCEPAPTHGRRPEGCVCVCAATRTRWISSSWTRTWYLPRRGTASRPRARGSGEGKGRAWPAAAVEKEEEEAGHARRRSGCC